MSKYTYAARFEDKLKQVFIDVFIDGIRVVSFSWDDLIEKIVPQVKEGLAQRGFNENKNA